MPDRDPTFLARVGAPLCAMLWLLLPVGGALAAELTDEIPDEASAATKAQENLTPEQRKMDAYASRQTNRGIMAVNSGNMSGAKKHLNEAIKIYEKHFGPNDERLVRPMLTKARIYTVNYQVTHKEKRRLMERVYEIYEANGKKGQDLARMAAQLGDWWIAADRPEKAWPYYEQAWQLVADDISADEANGYFTKPVSLYFRPPATKPRYDESPASTIQVTMGVDTAGRPKGMRIIETNAPMNVMTGLSKALEKRRYRPRMENGKVIETAEFTVKFTYAESGGFPAEEPI